MYASISTKFAKHHCGRSATRFWGPGVAPNAVRSTNERTLGGQNKHAEQTNKDQTKAAALCVC
jgi:hypothetical protein